ncbi:MAG: 2-amino-4-hydroxy-6-hydroxymethyldihydropteridine diphosphokinase [Clostridia bacterium]|jgi:2-amino-4-hydroxy-6-hydroxymethyldihydropteridine diphosphokinase|nr:2-amino-4-hydroxy-6-hydroxymethyldihydropteridine diphosphokinase [Clostridia bacterium]
MKTVYLGLGSNINPREEYLSSALKALKDNPQIEITKKSSIYETAPIGYLEQDSFLNMVIKLETQLEPLNLLSFCQEVEENLHRKRTIHWGPRTIDIDILLYYVDNKLNNPLIMSTEQLTLPHPRILERAFVLVPLYEIEPQLVIKGTTIKELVANVSDQEIRLYQDLCPF